MKQCTFSTSEDSFLPLPFAQTATEAQLGSVYLTVHTQCVGVYWTNPPSFVYIQSLYHVCTFKPSIICVHSKPLSCVYIHAKPLSCVYIQTLHHVCTFKASILCVHSKPLSSVYIYHVCTFVSSLYLVCTFVSSLYRVCTFHLQDQKHWLPAPVPCRLVCLYSLNPHTALYFATHTLCT